MNNEILDKQFVTYTNHLEFNGVKLAFKKKLLFDLTNIPRLISRSQGGWWVNRRLLTEERVRELVKMGDIKGLDEIYAQSDLPDSVDMEFVNELLLKIRHL